MSGAGWSFSSILHELKGGRRVAREGWNGKRMYLQLVQPVSEDVDSRLMLDAGALLYTVHGELPGRPLPWIGMKTADGCFVPWLASQTDILAEDWWVIA